MEHHTTAHARLISVSLGEHARATVGGSHGSGCFYLDVHGRDERMSVSARLIRHALMIMMIIIINACLDTLRDAVAATHCKPPAVYRPSRAVSASEAARQTQRVT